MDFQSRDHWAQEIWAHDRHLGQCSESILVDLHATDFGCQTHQTMEMNEEWLPNRGETICNLQGISS
jgi:hypothetical protein